MAVFRVQKNKDYTVMSNHHLRNASLSMKAKGLLSLMLSLPENWDYTLHGLSTISADGLTSIRAAVTELETAGYLKRQRLRNDKGQLADIEYTILEQPEPIANSELPPICEKPILDNQTLEKPILGKPILENRTQSNTYVSSKDESITDLSSIYQSIGSAPPERTGSAGRVADSIDAMEAYREVIRQNIEYKILLERFNRERLDELVQLIVDAICSRSRTIRIDRADHPAESVKVRLLQLKPQHIEYVLDCMDNNSTKIHNIRNYLLTALYNAPTTIDSYYQAAVNHDFRSQTTN